jgi:putative methyltransferase (TIGR04325 family)
MKVRDLVPSPFQKWISALRPKYGWSGNYASWDEAVKSSTGYDADLIVDKVKESLMKVKRGEAAFERDSVVFDKHEYVWPVLSGLLWIAAMRQGKLNVLDFGGSLGSTFFQYQKFFNALAVRWNIVEQEKFIRCGKQYFEDDRLRFYATASECLKHQDIDVVLFSSVLPYLEKPYNILQEIVDLEPPFMIFDKMPFLLHGVSDRLTVQVVPSSIYAASYPAWFFNEGKFHAFLTEKYVLVEAFENFECANIPSVFKGLIFQRK